MDEMFVFVESGGVAYERWAELYAKFHHSTTN
jgi:hypothetical protein